MLEIDEGAVRPEMFLEFAARHDIARPFDQDAQDLEWLVLQADSSRPLPELPPPQIQFERRKAERIAG